MTSVTFNVRCPRHGSFAIILFGSPKELGGGDPNNGVVLSPVSGVYSYRATVKLTSVPRSHVDWYSFAFRPQFGTMTFDSIARRPFPALTTSAALFDTIDVAPGITDVLIKFRIRCYTYYGQELFLTGNLPELGNWSVDKAVPLYFEGVQDYWSCIVRLPVSVGPIELQYKYFRAAGRDCIEWEDESNHHLSVVSSGEPALLEVVDTFRWSDPIMNAFTRSAFVDVINKRRSPRCEEPIELGKAEPGKVCVHFAVLSPHVRPHQQLVVVGNAPELGSWDPRRGLFLADGAFPLWMGSASIDRAHFPLEYKYVIVSDYQVIWEGESNRYATGVTADKADDQYPATLVLSEWFVCPNRELYKGLGVYAPIFSLRTQTSCGIGQYTDIKKLVDFCNKAGISLIQLLPINDTTDKGGWEDSYPYRQVSCFALHPIYIDLLAIPGLPEHFVPEIMREKAILEDGPSVDYPKVFAFKTGMFSKIFKEVDWSRYPDFDEFIEKNKVWLKPYALYCMFRDMYETSNFSTWPEHSTINPEEVEKLSKEFAEKLKPIYWLQYLCDIQFKDSRDYANEHGVCLKGDLPIGVYLNSVECWAFPNNFHKDMCAGAPPDAFSADGQNWGFPTYDWDFMAKDGYKWWRMRLARMAELFQVMRVDHILGFFRIWEIPREPCVRGMLGHYNPCVPLTVDELRSWGLRQDISRYVKPYVRWHILEQKFKGDAQKIANMFFIARHACQHDDFYDFKENVNTERKIADECAKEFSDPKERARIQAGLFELLANVILVPDPNHRGGYQVRTEVRMDHTEMTQNGPIEYPSTSWLELPEDERGIVERLYVDFAYNRQSGLWVGKALEKLDLLKDSTNMLICGEDLGQLTEGILAALREKALLSLRVQRMSKDKDKEFDEVEQFQYLSVCCPATHDSSSLRGWWEENRAVIRSFWHGQLWRGDEPPPSCEPWISEMIIKKHLWSNSMWAVFLLQDLAGITGHLRRQTPEEEQINIPADPHHKWRYRYPYSLEEITDDWEFTQRLHGLAVASHRI